MKEIVHVSGKRDRIVSPERLSVAVSSSIIIIISVISAMCILEEPNESSTPLGLEHTPSEISPEVEQKISSMSGWFTENQGQNDNPEVKYVYSASYVSVGFIESGYLIKLTNEQNLSSIVKVTLEGANLVVPKGREELSHRSNYFIGNDSTNWKRELRNFREVVFESLYDGIDLVFYGNENGLKYDFIVHPGSDPSKISMVYQGVGRLSVDKDGSLVIDTKSGKITDGIPYSYQEINDIEVEVKSTYIIDDKQVTFNIDEYNLSSQLIIDPILYSTFIGGTETDQSRELELGPDNSVYVASHTRSGDFPTTSGSYDDSYNGGLTDTVVYKFNSDLTELIFSTFIGGSDRDRLRGLSVDNYGCAYISSWIESDDYPTTEGCYDDTFDGDRDGAVVKLSNDGSDIEYSTYIGGSNNDTATGITVDSDGFAYVTGYTSSPDFPTTSGCYDPIFSSSSEAFIIKMNKDGSDLLYSSFLGGSVGSWTRDVLLDSENNVHVIGTTESPDFPTTPGCFDNSHNGLIDIFLCKLTLSSQGLQDMKYSTLIGGAALEYAQSMVIDDENNLYLTGGTSSPYFPTTPGSHDQSLNGAHDVFVLKLNLNNLGPLDLSYSTFIGGINFDGGNSIDIDSNNQVIISGRTGSSDFPTTPGCFDNKFNGIWRDAFVCKLSSDGSELIYSSYLNGEDGSIEDGWGIVAIDKDCALITAYAGHMFPVTPGCFDSTNNGIWDIVLIKIELTDRNLKPVIYDVAPTNHTPVSGSVMITGKGWDPNNPEKIKKVEISIDSGRWITVNGTAIWNYEWDTTTVDDGERTIRIRAYDGEYYSDTQEVILNVENGRSNLLFLIIIGISGTSIFLYLLYTNENVRYGFFLSPLYTRLKKDDLLDQPNRNTIYHYIISNPGTNLSTIFNDLDLGYGTLIHHLNILEKEGLIFSSKEMGIKRFNLRKSEDVSNDTYTESHISPLQREILEYLKEHDSITRREIEVDLGIKSSTLIYSLRRLREWGLIQRKGSRKNAEYSIKYVDW